VQAPSTTGERKLTIEFHCPHCDKALRTSDDKAGRLVKCPHCGETSTVPQGPPDTADSFLQDEYLEGATIEPRSRPTATPIFVDAGEIISTSWAIYKSQMGMLIGAVVLVAVLVMAANYLPAILGLLVEIGMQNNRMGRGGIGVGQIIQFAFFPLIWIFQIYMTTGQTILFLKIARGQPTEIGDIFRGGHYLVRSVGVSLLFGLIAGIGFILLIVPGLIAMLMFWPFIYVLVDSDLPGVGCLWRAREITRNTWGAILLIWLTSFGLNLLGVLACCVGVLFTAPLSMLLFAVAYCRMTGQSTASTQDPVRVTS
jgi:DNA-directed RNA polymerase subunit RPC12/RpoP